MSGSVRTIADVAAGPYTSVADAVYALRDVEDRGIWSDGRLTPWSQAVDAAAVRIAALRELLGSSSSSSSSAPSHVGLLLAGTPEYLHLLGAAACSEIVVAGLNPTRRGAALARDAALADCALILTDTENAGLLDGLAIDVPVISVDSPEWAALLARHAGAGLPDVSGVPVGSDDLVALVFTSGTSGDPKAVRITQSKISVPGRMLADRFGIGPGDCVYSAMPLFHSNAVMVAWPIALFTGCSIALRRRFSASNWIHDVRRHGCTFANYVGAPLSYILATPEKPDDADNPMRVVYGNEAPADVRREFARRFGVTVVDGFGSSEGGVSVSRTPDTPDAALGPLPAGVLIVDPETGAQCPRARFDHAGVLLNSDEAVGEMVSDGPGLFAGYYNDPSADAERMRGGRFHSGDLAYVDDDGWVYFAGRSGGWMRVDGENLAAAPVERVLRRHPDLVEVGVYAVPADQVRGPGTIGDAVAAAVVLRDGVDPVEVADGLGEFLADQSD
ncbi:MAG: AMP-binding protein, partial [Dietzia sp.]